MSPVKHTFEYDETNRFVSKDTNVSSGTFETSTYSKKGELIKRENPLLSEMTYDGFGRAKTQKDPYGVVTEISYEWGTTSNRKFCVKTISSITPEVVVWYDYLGREVDSISKGEGGIEISTKTTYNNKG